MESARTVQSKTQLWRYIEEIGIAPLLAAIKKNFPQIVAAAASSSSGASSSSAADGNEHQGGDEDAQGGVSAFTGQGIATPVDPIESGLLRTEAVEAILHLMNIAMDLVSR